MSKELEALEKIKEYRLEFLTKFEEAMPNEIEIIETALKRLEDYEETGIIFGILNGRREEELKALEFIKQYHLITYQECFNAICTKGYVHNLPQEVVDLLKKVLL